MFRLALVLAMMAGVTHVDAAPKKSKVESKTKAKKSKSRELPDKVVGPKSKRRGKRNSARIGRIPTRATLAKLEGMPPGFTWPPTRAMLAAEQECESKLDRAGVVWERGEPEGRIVNAIYVKAMVFGGIQYTQMWGGKGPHKLDCQLALALETIGPELRAIGVREVKFGSLYRWSNVRSHGQTRPILSRHGLGLAMDIGSFVDDAGKESVVKRDYTHGDELLLSIEQVVNASGNFRIVLTPKNDPVSHSDHFHIEARSDFTSPDVP
ncbi:MAG: extensin family protein [Kofleriaceae bacterium]